MINLYNSKDDPETTQPTNARIADFLSGLNLSSVTTDQLNSLNLSISDNEILAAIKTIPKGKSPGVDGFSAEYYQTFSNILTPYLSRIFNRAVTSAFFPPEMLRAIIVTLPNQGRNLTGFRTFS